MRTFHKALVTREEQLNPVWVRFRLNRQESTEWDRDANHCKEARERRWEEEGEYARKGNKARTWKRILAPDLSRWSSEKMCIYNGEIELHRSNADNAYILSRKWEGQRVVEPPFALAGEDLLRIALQNWVDGKDHIAGVSATESMGKDGKRRLAFAWSYPTSKWSTKARVLPDEGWALERLESFNERAEFVDRTEVVQFEMVSGIVFPKSGRAEHYMKGNVLGTTTTFVVESIETRAGQVPDTLFQFEFPPDAVLYDSDNKVTIRNSEAAESYLADIVRRLGPPRRQWLKWVGLAAGVIGVLAVVTASFRWWQRRGRPLPAKP